MVANFGIFFNLVLLSFALIILRVLYNRRTLAQVDDRRDNPNSIDERAKAARSNAHLIIVQSVASVGSIFPHFLGSINV